MLLINWGNMVISSTFFFTPFGCLE